MHGQQDALVLIGGGGHAVVVAQAARAAGFAIAGVFDDAPEPIACRELGLARLGRLVWLDDQPSEVPAGEAGAAPRPRAILCLGDLAARRRLIDRPRDARHGRFATIVHQRAIVAAGSVVAPGAFVGAGAIVMPSCDIGQHAIINTGAIVEHHGVIGENAHIAPGAILGGMCRVGRDALVGLGARVLPGVTIGAGAIIGAGAVVTRDVPPGATAVGIPARSVGG